MKTLDQVEARIPVSESTTPPSGDHQFTITQPGSYYLTGNVVVTKPSGIAIAATGVTLDLNGFSIRREAGNSGAGVEVFSARCAIMNGSIGGFGTGIAGTAALGGSVSRVRVSECGTGIFVGTAWRVEESTVVGGLRRTAFFLATTALFEDARSSRT